jgi:hypothetical protein
MSDDRQRLEWRDWFLRSQRLVFIEFQVLLTTAVAIALLFIGHGYHMARTNLSQSEAALRELAPPPIPEERNAAVGLTDETVVLVQASSLPTQGEKDVDIGDEKQKDDDPLLFSSAVWSNDKTYAVDGVLRRWLAANQPLIDQADKALDKREVVWPIDYSKGIVAPMPWIERIRAIAKVFECRVYLALHDCDWQTALMSLHKMTRLADHMALSPYLLSINVALAVEDRASNAILRSIKLAGGRWPSMFRNDVMTLAESREGQRWNLEQAFRSEMRGALILFDRLGSGELARLSSSHAASDVDHIPLPLCYTGLIYPWDRDCYSSVMDDALNKLRQVPLNVGSRSTLSVDDGFLCDPRLWYCRRFGISMAAMMTPSVDYFIRSSFRFPSRWRMAGLGLRLIALASANGGKWPDSLDALSLNTNRIEDPFQPGQPLRYRCSPDGRALLWSVGKNQIDQTGISQGEEPTKGYGDDIVLELEPVSTARVVP